MLHDALQHATSVLFVDADVVLFRNPFTTLSDQPAVSLRFQAELACDDTAAACTSGVSPPPWCHVNGGVLLVRDRNLVRAIVQSEPTSFVSEKQTSRLDQVCSTTQMKP